jgi:hypothetical protein
MASASPLSGVIETLVTGVRSYNGSTLFGIGLCVPNNKKVNNVTDRCEVACCAAW